MKRGLIISAILLGLWTLAVWKLHSAPGNYFPSTSSLRWVTPQQYGAIGGANDDTLAFSNALNSGNAVYVPNYTNYTTKILYLSNNAVLFGMGFPKITLKSGETGYHIDSTTQTNFTLDGIWFDGGSPPDTNVLYWQPSQGSRAGLHTYVTSGGTVRMCKFDNYTDAGFRIGDTAGGGPRQIGPVALTQTYRQSQLLMVSCEAKGNYYGYHLSSFDAGNLQEYVEFTDCKAFNNYYNLNSACGNTYINGGNFNGGHYGIYMTGGAGNDGHGLCQGAAINHNDIAVFVSNASGYTFSNCKMLGPTQILFTGATGATIGNSHIALTAGSGASGGGTNYMIGNFYWGGDPKSFWTDSSGSVTRWVLNQPTDGSAYSALSEFMESSNYFRGTLNQAGSNGEFWSLGQASELLTLSTGAATTDTTGNLLPANSIIEAVETRVTTTITTAASFSVGDPTTAARFSASAGGITAASTRTGIDHWSGAVTTLAAGPSQTAAAKVRITCNVTPGAGVIRITVFYRTFTPPGS